MSSNQLTGIDVSKWQGTVNWQGVKQAGNVFAFARATYGSTEVDDRFSTNWQGMKAAGLVRGAYHFFVTADDPTAQANLFIKTVGSLEPGDLPPVLDVESASGTNSTIVADVQQWLDLVEQGLGRKPIIYTAPSFWNENFKGGFGSYPLWVGEYEVSSPKPVNGWSTWTFWQYSQTGSVAGISPVDLDYFNGSPADLAALTSSADVPPATDATTSDTTSSGATSTSNSATGAPADPSASSGTQTYTVQPGDTLSAIAEKCGTSVNAICQANGIDDPNLIEVGQVLTIP